MKNKSARIIQISGHPKDILWKQPQSKNQGVFTGKIVKKEKSATSYSEPSYSWLGWKYLTGMCFFREYSKKTGGCFLI